MHGWETRMLLKHYLERGVSKAALARRFGVSRRTLHEWIESGQLDRDLSSGGARYSPRPPVPHKLDPYAGIIDSRLEEFPELSAKRLFDEVRAAGYAGSPALVVSPAAIVSSRLSLKNETVPDVGDTSRQGRPRDGRKAGRRDLLGGRRQSETHRCHLDGFARRPGQRRPDLGVFPPFSSIGGRTQLENTLGVGSSSAIVSVAAAGSAAPPPVAAHVTSTVFSGALNSSRRYRHPLRLAPRRREHRGHRALAAVLARRRRPELRNQQVSGSSPLAGSIKINNLQRQVIRLVWAESALSQQSHRAVSRQVFAQLARDGRSLVHGRTRPQSAPSTPPSRLGAGRCGSGRSRYDAAVET